jgi:hypothetical protein
MLVPKPGRPVDIGEGQVFPSEAARDPAPVSDARAAALPRCRVLSV